MGYFKKDVTQLLAHWSYVFLVLTHRYEPFLMYDKDLFIIYSLYHGCGWPGDARNQRRHGFSFGIFQSHY